MFPSTATFDDDFGNGSDAGFDDEQPKTAAKKKKSGGFESFGLTHNVYTGVKKKGYRVPTPIQRKVIPLVMAGKDVVAMARTGSGKTGAFLIPMLECLHEHSTKVGARGLILAPTRELAIQTFKFAKELGRFTDLRLCLLVGGHSFESQFENLSLNPDMIIATPGRLVHQIAEVQLSLKFVQFLVFDEADRMFEMGFEPQIRDITKQLPPDRKTLLFSATMPEQLAAFARAGLQNPEVVRLDADIKISPELQIQFFCVRKEEKDGALLFVLRKLVQGKQLTLVFAATRHHTEFLHLLLAGAGIASGVVYGTMDQVARAEAVERFRDGKVSVLLVTDVAARGIDIPLLDVVINYDFPPKPKLFVHRVGRAARAGRTGIAYSLVSPDEMPYMVDLHLFLGRDLACEPHNPDKFDMNQVCYGGVPQALLAPEVESARDALRNSVEMTYLQKTVTNAYKLYFKTRAASSPESVRRSKELTVSVIHPLLKSLITTSEIEKLQFIKSLQTFRPNSKGSVVTVAPANVPKRMTSSATPTPAPAATTTHDPDSGTNYDNDTSSIAPAYTPIPSYRDDNFFMEHYRPKFAANKAVTDGYAVHGSLNKLEELQLELAPDDNEGMVKKRMMMRWDARKKNYVQTQLQGNESILEKATKAKNESGVVIKDSKKKKASIYEEWKKNKRKHVQTLGDEDEGDADEPPKKRFQPKASKLQQPPRQPQTGRTPKSELKTEKEMRKKRSQIEDKHKSKTQRREEKQEFLKKRVARKTALRSAPTKSKMIKRRR